MDKKIEVGSLIWIGGGGKPDKDYVYEVVGIKDIKEYRFYEPRLAGYVLLDLRCVKTKTRGAKAGKLYRDLPMNINHLFLVETGHRLTTIFK